MRRFLVPSLLLSFSVTALAQAPQSQTQIQAPRPERQHIDAWVESVSASTAGRLLFWVRVPGGPPEGRPFTINPDMESPWGGSGVMGLLMTSYQLQRAIRIFYIPSAQPDGVGEIVRVDGLRNVPLK
jgi:hypothetical protein